MESDILNYKRHLVTSILTEKERVIDAYLEEHGKAALATLHVEEKFERIETGMQVSWRIWH